MRIDCRFIQKIIAIISVAIVLIFAACNSARHVPKGETLLDKVNITSVVSPANDLIETTSLINYVRQQPNHKILWTTKFQLGIYNLSGSDSSKWYNRWVRRLGEPPVVYDSLLTSQSAQQLRQALVNLGYLDASVTPKIITDSAKRKTKVDYILEPGKPHTINDIKYIFPDDSIRSILSDTMLYIIHTGLNLDRTMLDSQREIMASRLRNHGYYNFTKEYISFVADTTEGSLTTDLTIVIHKPDYKPQENAEIVPSHKQYLVRKVIVVPDYNPDKMDNLRTISAKDTVDYNGLIILYGDHRYIRPNILAENCHIRPAKMYSARAVEQTYESFSRLSILNFVSVKFIPSGQIGGTPLLDAYVLLTPGKSQSISLELEGTNSEGDLGVAAGITYTHRNIGHGGETFTTKFRGAYESLSGNLEGLINNRYMEYSADVGLTFPKFKFPFLRTDFKRKIRATTRLRMSLNYQERPEYTRIIATAGWQYRWSRKKNQIRYSLSPIDINYVYLPKSTNDFINEIAPDNPLLRYSYEDHFIMRLGGTFYYTTKHDVNPYSDKNQTTVSTVRINAETAGNLLYALNNIINHRPNAKDNPYKVFGIRYSQYVKAEADYSYSHVFDTRNSLAWHVNLGIAYPYGNSGVVPFEKRFYGGGANGVRGWDVRTLGPGSFRGTNSVSDFINQCGDICFDTSIEYRAKLFWVIELGLFIDAGNIWTIHSYSNQPGGMFKFNKFYREIAAAYGAGIRLDFSYFLIRFDLGMKAHNPAFGSEPWPLIHPRWGRDSSFHFSIGYPF